MKFFLNADSHGNELQELENKVDMVFIVGDFSKGDKLREAVFGNGRIEDAKEEILETARDFLSKIPKNSIVVPGNVEKLCLAEISDYANKIGISFLENEIIESKGLKIGGLKFFMEEWWARQVYPKDTDKIKRAQEEEKEVSEFLEKNPDLDIILSHLPPFDILDKDPNLLKNMPKSYAINCGSRILLDYIYKNKPLLVVCGHIHLPGEVVVGETRVINPGEGKIISI